jgi:hypothetical protein
VDFVEVLLLMRKEILGVGEEELLDSKIYSSKEALLF